MVAVYSDRDNQYYTDNILQWRQANKRCCIVTTLWGHTVISYCNTAKCFVMDPSCCLSCRCLSYILIQTETDVCTNLLKYIHLFLIYGKSCRT